MSATEVAPRQHGSATFLPVKRIFKATFKYARGDSGAMSHFSDYLPLHVNSHSYPKTSMLLEPLYILDGYPLRGIISVSDLYEIYDNNFNYYHYQPGSNCIIVYCRHITHARMPTYARTRMREHTHTRRRRRRRRHRRTG